MSVKRFLGPLLFAALATNLMAQQNVPSPQDTGDEQAQVAAPDRETENGYQALLEQQRQKMANAQGKSAVYDNELLQEYNNWTLSYTREAYLWHHQSTVMIFFMVLVVVLSGIILAAWQLRSWIKRVNAYDEVILKRLEQGEAVDTGLVGTVGQVDGGTLDIKKDALGISSPYVGVIILGLSMGFFLAYLLYVYPIVRGA